MALTKEFEYRMRSSWAVQSQQVRKATIIKDDGEQISRTYHRHVLQCRTKSGDPATWGDTDSAANRRKSEHLNVWTDAMGCKRDICYFPIVS